MKIALFQTFNSWVEVVRRSPRTEGRGLSQGGYNLARCRDGHGQVKTLICCVYFSGKKRVVYVVKYCYLELQGHVGGHWLEHTSNSALVRCPNILNLYFARRYLVPFLPFLKSRKTKIGRCVTEPITTELTRSMCNKRHLIRDMVYNFGKFKRHQLDSTQNLRDGEQNY